VTNHFVAKNLREPFSASTFRMAPVPVVVIGKNPKIASKVREGLLPEYDGIFSVPLQSPSISSMGITDLSDLEAVQN
jgi:hypothetical protein